MAIDDSEATETSSSDASRDEVKRSRNRCFRKPSPDVTSGQGQFSPQQLPTESLLGRFPETRRLKALERCHPSDVTSETESGLQLPSDF